MMDILVRSSQVVRPSLNESVEYGGPLSLSWPFMNLSINHGRPVKCSLRRCTKGTRGKTGFGEIVRSLRQSVMRYEYSLSTDFSKTLSRESITSHAYETVQTLLHAVLPPYPVAGCNHHLDEPSGSSARRGGRGTTLHRPHCSDVLKSSQTLFEKTS